MLDILTVLTCNVTVYTTYCVQWKVPQIATDSKPRQIGKDKDYSNQIKKMMNQVDCDSKEIKIELKDLKEHSKEIKDDVNNWNYRKR